MTTHETTKRMIDVFKSDKNQNMYIQNNVWTFYVTLL